MQRVQVECYSGYKADERPLRFLLGEICYSVEKVLDQWYGPGSTYFRVKADDGNLYVLRHSWGEDPFLWTLEAFRNVSRTDLEATK
jgi:hypothetical protein